MTHIDPSFFDSFANRGGAARASGKHRWAYCELCEDEMVICGKCGNNCCNGGYGEIDGKPCDACPSAYEKQNREYLARAGIAHNSLNTSENITPETGEA